jgi:hypothetical protein
MVSLCVFRAPLQTKIERKTCHHHFENNEKNGRKATNDKCSIAACICDTEQMRTLKLDSVLVPNDFTDSLIFAILKRPIWKDITSYLFFSYPTNFAAYEKSMN